MKTDVILVHGIRVSDGGEGSIGLLAPHFTAHGCVVHTFDYGRFGIFAPRWQNKGAAKELADFAASIETDRLIIVAHSNGAAVTHLAGQYYGLKAFKVVYIAAALDNDVEFPQGFTWFDVWHNPKDPVTWLARLPLWHIWGDMGRYGYTTHDYRGKNYNLLTNYAESTGSDHSPFSEFFGQHIAHQAVTTISGVLMAEPLVNQNTLTCNPPGAST